MGSSINRNDPCHCGSGKKYKHCHLQADEASRREAAGVASEEDIQTIDAYREGGGPDRGTTVVIVVAAILVAAVTLVVTGYPRWGVAVGGCGIIIAGIIWAVLDPPNPRQQAPDSAAIDFGRPDRGGNSKT